MTLAELITQAKEQAGESYADMAARVDAANIPGVTITKQYLAKLGNARTDDQLIRGLKATTVRALAIACRVSPVEVWAAAGESLGLFTYRPDVPGDPTVIVFGEHSPDDVARMRERIRRAAEQGS